MLFDCDLGGIIKRYYEKIKIHFTNESEKITVHIITRSIAFLKRIKIDTRRQLIFAMKNNARVHTACIIKTGSRCT